MGEEQKSCLQYLQKVATLRYVQLMAGRHRVPTRLGAVQAVSAAAMRRMWGAEAAGRVYKEAAGQLFHTEAECSLPEVHSRRHRT